MLPTLVVSDSRLKGSRHSSVLQEFAQPQHGSESQKIGVPDQIMGQGYVAVCPYSRSDTSIWWLQTSDLQGQFGTGLRCGWDRVTLRVE